MPADETIRLRIRQHFIELMDEELADAIMETMAPIPWTDLATKDDITDLRDDMTRLEAGLRSDIGGVRRDMTQLETGLRRDMTQLDTATDHKLEGLEGRLSKQIAESTRQVVLSMLFLMLGVIAAIAAFVNLG